MACPLDNMNSILKQTKTGEILPSLLHTHACPSVCLQRHGSRWWPSLFLSHPMTSASQPADPSLEPNLELAASSNHSV